MNTSLDLSLSAPALPMSDKPSLRQRTETAYRRSSTELLELFDALTPPEKKAARHLLRVQQLAFEVQNEELRQMLAAKTVHGHFALCVCGGACTDLPA